MTEPVAFVDIAAMQDPMRPALRAAFERVLQHGRYILGPEVTALESDLADYANVGAAIGVSSGTDALLATFLALGYQPGDEVITTPFSFISTATSVLRAGLRPVFVDLADGAFHPSAAQIERAIGPKTRAVLVVHLFGEPLDLAQIAALCEARQLDLVEDCAQAIGARRGGVHVGATGRAGTLSFFPAKNLGALGDGGAVLSSDKELEARIRAVRQHGCIVKYRHDRLGGNFRLDALQAALLQVLLPALDGWIESRRANATRYFELFEDAAVPDLVLPSRAEGHTYNQFVIRSPRRDAIVAALREAKIGHAIYYPFPLHTQPALAVANPPPSLPATERACEEVLALPIAPGLTSAGIARVVECVARAGG